MKKIILSLVLCMSVCALSANDNNRTVNSKPDSVFTVQARLYYPVNVTKRIDSYMDNQEALKILSTLNKDDFEVESIKISGWASPESPEKYNQGLSEKRAATIKSILQDLYKFPENVYQIQGNGEQWDGVFDFVQNSDNQLIAKYAEPLRKALEVASLDGRERALKAIGDGSLYRLISKTVFPKLRYADCEIKFKFQECDAADAAILNIQPEPTPVVVPVMVPVPVETVVEKEVIKKDKKFWRISLSAGPQVYWGDNDKYMMRSHYGDCIKLGITLDAQRWFNPYIGIGLGVNGYKMSGLYHDHFDRNGDSPRWATTDQKDGNKYLQRDGKNYYRQSGYIFDPYLYVVTNLINDFGGVKEGGRIYNLYFSAGAGVPFSETKLLNDYKQYKAGQKAVLPGFSINASLVNAFRVAEHLELLISINGGAMNDNFDGEYSRHQMDGTYSIMGGLGFTF